ncbi:putative Solute carrier family 35 member F6 [Blattamonas nauphoetae]|uniref:Solute carrier family 35 member F6 n=1 Tax=Blattamonas nauphoetae TaxID=2049346 RepID=A0ABQ9XDA1_9EUKA|nr:putative Solute carrier family 35 member F6 [Blattamonas nauphoetae]
MVKARFVIFTICMLITDSANTVLKKIQYQTCAPGLKTCKGNPDECSIDLHPTNHPFDKAFFQTAIMFVGESLCFLWYFIQKLLFSKKMERQQILDKTLSKRHNFLNILKTLAMFALFGLCDLTGTTLAGIGLIYVPGSAFQLLRGSVIVFTELGSVFLFKQRCICHRWIGIMLVVAALACIGVAGILDKLFIKTDSQSQITTPNAVNPVASYVIGIALIVSSQIVASIQMIFEEKMLKGKQINPTFMIGFEGIFGLVMCAGIALPVTNFIRGDDCGRFENIQDTFAMLSQSKLLLVLNIVSIFSFSAYNPFSLAVSKYLSAVHRTIIDSCTVVVVWVSLIVVNLLSKRKWGEPWTKFSPIQLAGFVLVVFGSFVFNGTFNCCSTSKKTKQDVPAIKSGTEEDLDGYEPLLGRSSSINFALSSTLARND